MFYNLSQRLQNSCFSFSFQLQPEFYGADAVDKPAYSRSRARKLGRYVRIFPYRHIPDTPFICMQVEIFGEPYISKCFLMNRLVSSCPKTNNQTQTKRLRTFKLFRRTWTWRFCLLHTSSYSFLYVAEPSSIQGTALQKEGEGVSWSGADSLSRGISRFTSRFVVSL